jgi:hypothetical protein
MTEGLRSIHLISLNVNQIAHEFFPVVNAPMMVLVALYPVLKAFHTDCRPTLVVKRNFYACWLKRSSSRLFWYSITVGNHSALPL